MELRTSKKGYTFDSSEPINYKRIEKFSFPAFQIFVGLRSKITALSRGVKVIDVEVLSPK